MEMAWNLQGKRHVPSLRPSISVHPFADSFELANLSPEPAPSTLMSAMPAEPWKSHYPSFTERYTELALVMRVPQGDSAARRAPDHPCVVTGRGVARDLVWHEVLCGAGGGGAVQAASAALAFSSCVNVT